MKRLSISRPFVRKAVTLSGQKAKRLTLNQTKHRVVCVDGLY
jgi:hypothetical protein